MRIESQYGVNAIAEFLPRQGNNRITVSRLNSITAHVGQTNVYGIKYVIKGSENYLVNKQHFKVCEGQYLLVNKGQDLGIDYKHRTTVHGLCVSLDSTLIGNTYHDLITDEESLLDNPFGKTSLPEFHETVYSSHDCIGSYLKQLSVAHEEDVYHDLAYRLVASQKITQRNIQNIKASRASTKKELFNRLNIAKNIIDDDFTHKISVADLAREAALSEFHFFRSFKEAFGVSPHQYILSKRLRLAKDLLLKRELAVTEVAYQSGFNDVFSFSKAFKKQFKVAPSHLAGFDKIKFGGDGTLPA